jgi:hypothetical protein
MDTAEGHFVSAIPVRKVFPIAGFRGLAALKTGNRNISLVDDKGRTGKGPEQFRLLKLCQLSLYGAGVGIEIFYRVLCLMEHRRVDLCLIFAEISYNMFMIRKRMGRMSHISLRCDTKTFLF